MGTVPAWLAENNLNEKLDPPKETVGSISPETSATPPKEEPFTKQEEKTSTILPNRDSLQLPKNDAPKTPYGEQPGNQNIEYVDSISPTAQKIEDIFSGEVLTAHDRTN